MALGLLFAVLVALVVWAVASYNRLVGLRNQVQNGWRQIDVQLKRRHDLIPNLVNAVRGAMDFERDTLTSVMEARAKALTATGPADAAVKEGQLSQAVGRLLAVAENYPQLQASEQFTSLQSSLNQTEDAIQNSRRYYNAVVRDLNTKIATFPGNIIAGMFSFHPRQFFQTETTEDRATPVVKF